MATAGDVLVVDDERDLVESMVRLLRIAGYPARSARNGVEALEAVSEAKPAVVLLDILMPVMDGWECARELRARYDRDLPIVIVTAAEHIQARCREIDADDVLAKPFDLQQLLEVVSGYTPRSKGNVEEV